MRAEEAAARWLVSRGWKVLARRWRSGVGELDLVCRDPAGILVGVEVKVRSSGRAGSGGESVDRRRVARLHSALGRFAALEGAPAAGLRLDLVSLEPGPDAGRWRLVLQRGIDAW
jgi:putative endonuclease